MKHFTEEQLKELEEVFGLVKIKKDTVKILDATVKKGSVIVWWHSKDGPEQVTTEADWSNIERYPDFYSISKPKWNEEMECYIAALEGE